MECSWEARKEGLCVLVGSTDCPIVEEESCQVQERREVGLRGRLVAPLFSVPNNTKQSFELH